MLSLKARVSLATALIPKSRTKLFQFSHFNSIQTRIIWILCLNPLALLLLLRYSAAFRTNYDVNNFNTWKSIYWKSWSLALLFVPHHRHAFLYFFFKCRLRVVPHFSSGIVERAKRERAWKSPHARKGFSLAAASRLSRVGWFSSAPRFARSSIPEEKWGTTRSLFQMYILSLSYLIIVTMVKAIKLIN